MDDTSTITPKLAPVEPEFSGVETVETRPIGLPALVECDALPEMADAEILKSLNLPQEMQNLEGVARRRLLCGARYAWACRRLNVEDVPGWRRRHDQAATACTSVLLRLLDGAPIEQVESDATALMSAMMGVEEEAYQAVLTQDGGYTKNERFTMLELD